MPVRQPAQADMYELLSSKLAVVRNSTPCDELAAPATLCGVWWAEEACRISPDRACQDDLALMRLQPLMSFVQMHDHICERCIYYQICRIPKQVAGHEQYLRLQIDARPLYWQARVIGPELFRNLSSLSGLLYSELFWTIARLSVVSGTERATWCWVLEVAGLRIA